MSAPDAERQVWVSSALARFHYGRVSGPVEADLATARKSDLRYRSPASLLDPGTFNALISQGRISAPRSSPGRLDRRQGRC
jgi:hypothetical protein